MAIDDKTLTVLRKLKNELPFYSSTCLEIISAGSAVKKMHLSKAQLYVHERLEEQRKRTGMVRAIILKGRQMGISTYCQARALHKTQYMDAYSAIIIANNFTTSSYVYNMLRQMLNSIPEWVPKPDELRNNTNQMSFSNLSGFRTLSADSANAGRGNTIQYLHGSEVAMWANEEEIVTSLLPSIHPLPETEVILESTPKGAKGLFYRMAMQAHAGEGVYQLIFLPWFWHESHKMTPPPEWSVPSKDIAYMEEHGLSIEQMYFRAVTILTYGSVARFRQEFPATVEEAFKADVEGALWTRDDIVSTDKMPEEMKRVVIGVDPATTAKKKSDETGIIVAGLGMDNKVYVLDDGSGKMPVERWANRVIELYEQYGADKIVAETNQGGDMVIHSIRAVDPTANVSGRHVSVSKVARHEPVAALYKQGKVIHASGLTELEDQMCSWNPITHPRESPDRVDALTLALGDLLLSLKRTPFIL